MQRQRRYIHRDQHMRRLGRTRGARGTGRGRYARTVEVMKDRFAFDALERNIQCVRHPACGIAHYCAVTERQHALLQPVAQSTYTGVLVDHGGGSKLRSLAEPDDAGDVLRATTPGALLMATTNKRTKLDA